MSAGLNRQIGLLIDRRGSIIMVIVGDSRGIFIPSLDFFRAASTRFKGLRLIHTHLSGESLTDEDLTDMSHLRLDLVGALEVRPDGSPGKLHWAHLIPENPRDEYWLIREPQEPYRLNLDFLSFMAALEDEFARQQKTRKIDAAQKAILVRLETNPQNDAQASLDELKQLAESCGVAVFDTQLQFRPSPDPKYMVGRGRLADIDLRASQIGANMIIFDHELSPAQVRSISDFTGLEVVDRTQVILDIFAHRAHSREGKIQVELAQLRYLLPRLMHKDTSLSRLAGGIGTVGPGETKLEIDRRRIRERIGRLEKDLKSIARSRGQRRGRREKSGLPVISIVGYTNAGKSTLLNSLTQSSVVAENKLFATLDTKSARLRFPRDTEAVITDTVGFIRDLPAELMNAFRATLDELQGADLLVHVIDASNERFEEQIAAVENILEKLGIGAKPAIRVFNKADRFEDKELLAALCRRFNAVAVCALHRENLRALIEKIEAALPGAITMPQEGFIMEQVET